MRELHELLLWLCSIPSVTGGEREIADEIAQYLASLATPLVARRHENSLVVPLTRGASGPSILLVAQLDTTDVASAATPGRDGERVVGAGAADAKSGLALLLALTAQRPVMTGNVTLVLHAGGEAGFDNSELGLVFAREPELRSSDFALVMNPTSNRLQLGC
ncbi:MAG TPA: succinyl-diaminopimelate desuccinylase, partial [Polyangiaceae bacterium]|nr:succinyl-diaminopimelate desuccinylase [Polyangiaceae bacterium]